MENYHPTGFILDLLQWSNAHQQAYLPFVKRMALAARYASAIIFMIVFLRVTLMWEHGYSTKSTSRYNLQRSDKYVRWSWVCLAIAITIFASLAHILDIENSPLATPLLYTACTWVSASFLCIAGVLKLVALSVGRGANKIVVLPYLAIPTIFMILAVGGWL